MKINLSNFTLQVSLENNTLNSVKSFFEKNIFKFFLVILTGISVASYIFYLNNGLGLAYNDARSHLDIGRRVVEGLKPGLAQIGSVWLPLPHILMVPTVWNDFMWHSGLSGALPSMASFVATGLLIYMFLKKLGVGMLGRLVGILVFVANINILYMQSTAMTELLLLATMTACAYELLLWHKKYAIKNLIKASFWVMLASLVRYDGWFLLVYSALLVSIYAFKKKGYKSAEGRFILYCTLGGWGVLLWLLWNLLIFNNPLYFAFGPYSAHAQQAQLAEAGVLATEGNLPLSLNIYFHALTYNTGAFTVILGAIGAIVLFFDKKVKGAVKLAASALFAPFIFNIIALYLGHSVLFIQGLSGDTWFNVRYGLMMMPSIAIFIGYLVHKAGTLKYAFLGLFLFVTFFSFTSGDAVTIDDARVGSSQKNVSEVSGWLRQNAKNKDGFVLISAASHDAIIFSSGLPMSKFIHEGTGEYWKKATKSPNRWARWIIMRTNDNNDQTFRLVNESKMLDKYKKVGSYPFADIYELKPEHLSKLNTKPILGNKNDLNDN